MIMVILQYRALAASATELGADKTAQVPFFESIPGLIDKTWAQNDETGRGVSVYHFEDRASADVWFDSDRQREFRRINGASIEYFDVGAIAVRVPLRPQ
jgi:heme-degrading monooxygenase HmoA